MSKLGLAAKEGKWDLVDDILSQHDSSDAISKKAISTCLYHACSKGRLSIVAHLFKLFPETNVEHSYHRELTLLLAACREGHLPIVKYLIEERNADIGHRDDIGRSPLMYAFSRDSSLPVVKYLVQERNANIEEKDSDGRPGFIYAISNLPVLRYLVRERNCLLNVKDAKGRTLLMYACSGGHVSTVKFLVEEVNASLGETDRHGFTSLIHTCNKDFLTVAKYLVDERNDDYNRGKTMLLSACKNGALRIVKFLVEEKNCDIEYKPYKQRNYLMYACLGGSLSTVKYLISQRGANFTKKDEEGRSCFLYACRSNRLSVVKYLVEELNANVNEKDKNGKTSLMYACENGRLAIAKYLIEEKGVDIDKKILKPRMSALLYACSSGNLDLVRYLVDVRNAHSELQHQWHRRGLFLACKNGHLSIVKFFMIEHWVAPAMLGRYPDAVNNFLKKYSNGRSLKRVRSDTIAALSTFVQSRMHSEWISHQQSTFNMTVPLRVTHAYNLVERKPNAVADLKVEFSPSGGSESRGHQSKIVVYAQKEILAESCTFMYNILMGMMNDVQPGADEEAMETVELSQELLQGCTVDWMKQLLIFLSWSEDGDHLHHTVKYNSNRLLVIPFQHIVEALMYCRMSLTLALDLDLSIWIGQIQDYIEKYNNQWKSAVLAGNGSDNYVPYCISNISPGFDFGMFELWTQVLGESDPVLFFMLLNAAPATQESPTTIAATCARKIQSNPHSGSYKLMLEHRLIVALINERTGYNIRTGVTSVPYLEEEEEFVKRKRQRIE